MQGVQKYTSANMYLLPEDFLHAGRIYIHVKLHVLSEIS